MSTFDDLKNKAAAAEAKDKAAAESWIKSNRAWLIVSGCMLVAGFILGKLV